MATTGSLQIKLFNGARKPWAGTAVRVVLTDPFAGSSNKNLVDKTVPPGTDAVLIDEIPADSGQRYIVFLTAEGHRSHAVFPIKPMPSTTTPINMMLIRQDPQPNFAPFSFQELQLRSPIFHQMLSQTFTEVELLDLPVTDKKTGTARLASLLNIEAKLRATALKQGDAVDFVQRIKGLESIEPDRIKIQVLETMPANVRGLKTFTVLNEAFNEMNHKGFPVSFKEKVAFCSLQLSFAKKAVEGGLDADIDIDLLTDIGHFGEVIKNKITKMTTDPFTVYNLLFDQNIAPLYTIDV
jgi:hypothetical protein